VSNDGLFTDGTDQFAPKVNSIPLSDVDTSSSETSVGQLVSNATEQMSQLVRSEVELAKTELAESAKKGGIGAGLFGGAGTIALYSSFFFFLLPGGASRRLAGPLGSVPDRLLDHDRPRRHPGLRWPEERQAGQGPAEDH